MKLLVDIGNSAIKMGVFDAQTDPQLIWQQSIPNEAFTGKIVKPPDNLNIQEVIVASVKYSIKNDFATWVKTYFPELKKLIWLSSETIELNTLKIINCGQYASQQLGIDRLMNLYGAVSLFLGEPKLIIDFGTMCTMDILGENNEFLGGVILPGPGSLKQLLPSGIAEQLTPHQFDLLTPPERVVGLSSLECLHSGFHYGYIGMIENMIKTLLDQHNLKQIIIAGGGAVELLSVVRNQDYNYHYCPLLTLNGIHQFLVEELSMTS